MKARFEERAHWDLLVAFVIPFVITMALIKLCNKSINQLGYSVAVMYAALTLAVFVLAIRKAMEPRKILTLQIVDGVFSVNDGSKIIIEEKEKNIELILDKVTQRTSGTVYGQVGLCFMNRRKKSKVLIIIGQHHNQYNWKPNIRAKYILGLFGRYEIDKEEALKVIRYYGLSSPIG